MIDGLEITEALLKASNRDKLSIRCRLHHCERVAKLAVDLLLIEVQDHEPMWEQTDIEVFGNACKMHDCVKYLVSTKEHGGPASDLFDVLYKNENCMHFEEIKIALKSHSRKELGPAMDGDEFLPLRCIMFADVLDKIALESILYSDTGLKGSPKEISDYIIKMRGKIMQYFGKVKSTFRKKKQVEEYVNRVVSLRIRDYANMDMIVTK